MKTIAEADLQPATAPGDGWALSGSPPLGIESEGESWMAGDIPLRLVNRNPKVTTTEDGQVTYEFWVEEP